MSEQWLEELTDEVIEKINPVCKFKTHKQKKDFMGEVKALIKETVNNQQNARINPREKENIITRPNPNKATGFAVMTEGRSAAGDEILGVGPSGPTK
jgi:hypothetical protein